MKNVAPIKRHPAFVALSKDHHHSLMLGWKIKTGLNSDVSLERISNYVLYFFKENLQYHFREEEQLIFSKMPSNDVLRQQAEAEHENIYSIIEKIKQ